jgi:spore germination cell wall hydrolase CwlJ-like protein
MYKFSIGLVTVGMLFLIFLNIYNNKSFESLQWHEFKPQYNHLTIEMRKEIQCLAKNIYFEARNEPIEGQVAVAFVTLNRVMSPNFPSTICQVVEQRNARVCQFSWLCEEKPSYIYRNNLLTINDDKVYNKIRDLSVYVYANYENIKDPTYGSLFYHADYVSPNWNKLQKVVTIGRHIFYIPKET